MRAEDGLGRVGVDRPALVGQGPCQPGSLGRDLAFDDVVLPARGVGEDEVGQHRPDDHTDDEQPPVELGVHGWTVGGATDRTGTTVWVGRSGSRRSMRG